jgi:hypothetical protein
MTEGQRQAAIVRLGNPDPLPAFSLTYVLETHGFGLTTEGTEDHRESRNPRPVSPKTGETRTGHPPFHYCAGVCGAAGVGASAVTSGVIGLIFTVERICSRRLKTLSRSTCLTRPSAEASVVTFRANS